MAVGLIGQKIEYNFKIKIMKVTENIVSFQVAKLAKEKGFSMGFTPTVYSPEGELVDLTLPQYRGFIPTQAPTQALLQKWLREEHKLYVTVDVCVYGDEGRYSAELSGYGKKSFMPVLLDGFTIYDTYEEALEEGLREALGLLEHNK